MFTAKTREVGLDGCSGTNWGQTLFGDGRMSIFIAAGGRYPGDLLMTAVHCPKELPGNYLNVRLRGVRSNRDGNGARITLQCGESAQMREVNHGTGFGWLTLEQHSARGTENPPVNQCARPRPGWVELCLRVACEYRRSEVKAVRLLEDPCERTHMDQLNFRG